MEAALNSTETLKTILKNFRNPALLDDHPWTRSLIVQEGLARDPRCGLAGPGHQLVQAIAGLFSDMQPQTPPRRGKRIDPRWGEFGLLAALYFTPVRQGTPFPTSLLDAWRRIDSAILYAVYGKPAAMLSREEIQKFELVGEEVEYGSTSTLSDWHRKGVQRLAEIVINREQYLSRAASVPPTIVDGVEGSSTSASRTTAHAGWFAWLAGFLILAVFLAAGAFKGRQLYVSSQAVLEDAHALQQLGALTLQPETLEAVQPQLLQLKSDLATLQGQAGPLLWLSPGLGWVPVYGGDLAVAPAFLQMAGHLVEATNLAYQASGPLLAELGSSGSTLDPAGLTALLVTAQPQLSQARQELDGSLAARSQIDVGGLSPRLQTLLTGRVDPLLKQADTGLSLATSLPVVLGASGEGPKTYLLLVQNEDELRATGGLITSVGRLVIDQGQVLSIEFEVEYKDDWSKPYPAAPWQMREYMNSPVLLLRDANWSPDFPTSARMAETLYAYDHDLSVDGVIAFDQQFLVMLLQQLGPLQLEGVPEPITAENVTSYMRSAKEPPATGPVPENWKPKEFIPKMTAAVLQQLMEGGDHNWREIAKILSQALEQRHLLLQFDNPEVTALLARQGWANTVDPGTGDFLLVTDTNMGFNKTNAVVEEGLSYDVNFTDLSQPQATLTVTHVNRAKPEVPCIQWNEGQIDGEKAYPIDRCYWSYLRVYKQAGTQLLEATPMAIPGEWMLLGRGVPARVDPLDEALPGLDGLGTMLVLPGGKSLDTGFHFALPAATLVQDGTSGQFTYHLKVQKQPGTLAVPIQVRVRLPAGAQVLSAPAGASVNGAEVLLSTDLQKDLDLQVMFRIP
jgi:hypothetical protein